MKDRQRRGSLLRAGIVVGLVGTASALAVVVGTPSAQAKAPTHPLVPGSVVISEATYPSAGNPAIAVGQPLPQGGNAVADGKYPEVFNNASVDPNFSVTAPFDLVDVDPSGNQLLQIKVPSDQITTSFASKSEGAINFSTDGQDLSFLGYNAPPNALDASNSDTPGARDATNPDTAGPFNRVAADLAGDGTWTFTDANSYSGDNGRAVILNNASNVFYAAGNSNDGASTTENDITDSGGAQAFAQSFDTQAGQAPGAPIKRLGLFTFSTSDKFGKDTNFRGLTIFNNVVYMTKGSGSNGTNSVYFVDTKGGACQTTKTPFDLDGLPDPSAALPALPANAAPNDDPYQMCVLNGFNKLAAKGKNAPPIFPFGIWFANATTLYVADEGSGDATFDPNTGTYTAAAAQTGAGLQKWVLNDGVWSKAYTLQSGLDLGRPYTVPGYPKGANPANDQPWAPATDGLRNISGHVNGDGTVTIYAATSTVSGSGDEGADPNKVVAITDSLAATAPGSEQFTTIAAPSNRTVYRGVAVVPDNYGN